METEEQRLYLAGCIHWSDITENHGDSMGVIFELGMTDAFEHQKLCS